MPSAIEYLSAEKIIELNVFAIAFIKAKKSDSAKVLGMTKLRQVVEDYQNCTGDVYDKAIVLLKGIIQKHPFASGNRRTAFLAAKIFLEDNREKLGVPDNPDNVKVMQGIRENYYSDEEIKEWLKNGKIRAFIR